MKTSKRAQTGMGVVLGCHAIRAFVVCPDKYKVLGIVRMGMEFGLLATTESGSYVRVNGSTVSARDLNMTRRFEMDTRQIKLLRETCALVSWSSEALTGNFYIHLFNVDPMVQTVYAENKISPVSGMLGFMGVAIAMLDDQESLKNMLRQASPRHVGYGALPGYFPAIGEALLLTLETALEDKFTPEVRQAWADFYHFMSDCMTKPAPQEDERWADPTQMALHLEDLLEDPGPQSAHLPLLDSTDQTEMVEHAQDASRAHAKPMPNRQLHLNRH